MVANANTNPDAGNGEELTILSDADDLKQTLADARLMGRAIRERWPIDEQKRMALVNRLCRIVEKEDVATTDQQGGVQYDEDKADRNATAAARVLVAMMAQNQRDEQPQRQAAAPVVNVGVQVNGNTQPGRTLASSIAQRIRLERLPADAPDGDS